MTCYVKYNKKDIQQKGHLETEEFLKSRAHIFLDI